MQKYSTYKSSNIEWLGDVPSHWRVTRIINRVESRVGGDWGEDPDTEKAEHVLLPVIRVQDMENEYEIGTDKLTYRKIKQSKIEHRLLNEKTLLIEKSGGGEKQVVGRVALPKKITMPAICSNFMEKIEMDTKSNPAFFNYLFHALYNQNMNFPFVQQTTGIQNLSSTYYLYTKVAYPERTEQTAIAAYLDQATEKIDSVVAAKQKQLEILEQYKKSKIHECVTKGLNPNAPMKQSGVEWIGDVPENWKVEKLKRRMSFVYGDALKEENRKEGKFNVYGSNGIVGTHEFGITTGETIIIGRKGTAGALNYSYESCYPIDTAYFIDKTATEENIRFLFFALQTLDLDKMNEDSAVPGLSRENAYEKKLGFPIRAEQKQIADYLDNFCSNIAEEKTIIQKQIACLQQYRKSLIHECVTGKRKVTD